MNFNLNPVASFPFLRKRHPASAKVSGESLRTGTEFPPTQLTRFNRVQELVQERISEERGAAVAGAHFVS